MDLLGAPRNCCHVRAYKRRGQIISFKVMQGFHYFENDRIQWRWILIRWSGQVKHIVLFMMRSWLHYQKSLCVSTQHFPFLCCSGLNWVSCSFLSQSFPLPASENEASHLDTWMLDLMTQCLGHRPEPYSPGVKSQIFLKPAGSDVVKWHQAFLLTHGERTEEIGNLGQKSGDWGFSIPIFPAAYLINGPQLITQFSSATVFSVDSQECWETWVIYVPTDTKIAFVGFQSHLKWPSKILGSIRKWCECMVCKNLHVFLCSVMTW